MGYPFPQVPYKVYKKTFLKDVHLIFKFVEVYPDDTIYANARRYYNEKFRVKTQGVDIADGINIKSKDEMILFDFKWDGLIICMKSPMYKSFDLTLEVMKYALSFFEAIGVKHIEKIVFYKFNELAYNVTKDVSVSQVMKQIFSEELLKYVTKEDEDVQLSLSRWEKPVSFENDNHDKFTIEFGFNCTAKESTVGSLTLKTKIETKNTMPVSDIEKTLRELNQILDNAFHWSVLPNIVKEMEKSHE